MNSALLLVALLQAKHFLADFLFQSDWQVRNKGSYGHPAGLVHAGQHALLTVPCLLVVGVTPALAAAAAAAEFLIHYHQDWTKEWLGRQLSATPDRKIFWVVLGGDQLLHQMAYLGMAFLLL